MSQRFANVSEVPLALAVFLSSDGYDYNDDPCTISATTLLKPLRQIILPSRIPPGEGLVNLADMMSNRMGAAIHDGIERAWLNNHAAAMTALGYPQHIIERVLINPKPEQIQDGSIPIYLEQRLHRKLGKWTISGKFDFVGEGKVQDFKSTSVWTYKNQVNNQKYAQQGSVYRWLDPKLITQDVMDIHYIFTDWKPAVSKTDHRHPQPLAGRQRRPGGNVRVSRLDHVGRKRHEPLFPRSGTQGEAIAGGKRNGPGRDRLAAGCGAIFGPRNHQGVPHPFDGGKKAPLRFQIRPNASARFRVEQRDIGKMHELSGQEKIAASVTPTCPWTPPPPKRDPLMSSFLHGHGSHPATFRLVFVLAGHSSMS